jgi:hypothetical protein
MNSANRRSNRQDRPVRWDALFDDLEAQAAALSHAEVAGEVEERTRGEVGKLEFWDRARGSLGAVVRIRLRGGVVLGGRLARAGPDWLLLEENGGRESVILTSGVLGLRGLGRHSAVPGSAGIVESRLRARQVLRALARDRSAVGVLLADGSAVDATIDRVGADFIEVAEHSSAEPRRRQEVRSVELLPLSAITAVRRSV